MDADIQLGPLQQAATEQAIRPDRDRRYLTATCGRFAPDDLPIFVDLDVMRDMEAHARSNTNVELGGVMLGVQCIDAEGAPFIMVTDALRARHYEATRGSFKFTADTWSQITRDRAELPGHLQMIGWYHTHPGWGVFLSGLDRFICNHFFGRPLDVALVIDPCSGERGWFQWAASSRKLKKKRKVKGFFLMANRYRKSELEYYQRLYSGPGSTSMNSHSDSHAERDGLLPDSNRFPTDDSRVNMMDARRTVFDLAVVSVLLLQLVMASLFGWKLLEWTPRPESADVSRQQASEAVATARETAYAEILESVVAGQTGQEGMVEEMMEMKEQKRLLRANLQGQLARVEQIRLENHSIQDELDLTRKRAHALEQQVAGLQDKNLRSDRELRELRNSAPMAVENRSDPVVADESGWWQAVWPVYGFWGSGLIFLLGGFAGCLVARCFVSRVDPGREPSEEVVDLVGEADRLEFERGDKRPPLSRLEG
ncbi:MAG: Mov34/MPN/PAD-1 family protein [Mariniblastus sp.]|nr:Mov34/MPN/PAD-1 family protein [Mariniblastus sp.]